MQMRDIQTDDGVMRTPVTFGAGTLDRAAHMRGVAESLWQSGEARVLAFWLLKPFIAPTGGLALVMSGDTGLRDFDGPRVFLGVDHDGRAVFAADLSDHWSVSDADAVDGGFLDESVQVPHGRCDGGFCELRREMLRLDPWEADVAAAGRALLDWHLRHGFCAACGAPTDLVNAGWQRNCASCGASHFPRTDPVVIMLITYGNSVLLGRNAQWPEGMYSLLAGFVEPGEPIEAAVRREVFEEASVRVGDVRYVATQPWPFPASLMFGCVGEALTHEITVDPEELEDALWLSREDLARAMAGEHPLIKPAREGSIAHYLLRNWLADTL